MDENNKKNGLGFFYSFGYFIVTVVSNGANITDGIDGLASGTSVVILGH